VRRDKMDNSIVRGEPRKTTPPVSIAGDEGEVVVQIEMPGVVKEGLDIKIEGDTLSVDAKRSDEVPKGKFLLRERRHDEYLKAFTIDESIDHEGISADLTDGVLTLRLKVKPAAQPRKIKVG
jgi:HSP20 family protein